jgi:putative membrane protein
VIEFLAHLLVSAALLLLVAGLIPGVQVAGWGPAFLGAIVLGLVNAIVRPIMVVLTLPLTVLTFGLFLLVINAFMLWLMAAVAQRPRVDVHRRGLAGCLKCRGRDIPVGGDLNSARSQKPCR